MSSIFDVVVCQQGRSKSPSIVFVLSVLLSYPPCAFPMYLVLQSYLVTDREVRFVTSDNNKNDSMVSLMYNHLGVSKSVNSFAFLYHK